MLTEYPPTQPNIYKSHWSKGLRMSKAALNAAAMSLSHDLASNEVAVGIYHPGYVQTEMVNYGG
ncbi:MAG: NAD(P)-dependent dehydrogenase (short-subunit alcohol dehydrogenase family), partial [Pseudohongiellaceae bacterium]